MALDMSTELSKRIDQHIADLIEQLTKKDRLGKKKPSAISTDLLIKGFPDKDTTETFKVFSAWVKSGVVVSAFTSNIQTILDHVGTFLKELDSTDGTQLLALATDRYRAKVKTYTNLYMLDMLYRLKTQLTPEGIQQIFSNSQKTLESILTLFENAKTSEILDWAKSQSLILTVSAILSDLAEGDKTIEALYQTIMMNVANKAARRSDYVAIGTKTLPGKEGFNVLDILLGSEASRLSTQNEDLIAGIIKALSLTTLADVDVSKAGAFERLGINTTAPATLITLRPNKIEQSGLRTDLANTESEVIDLLAVITRFKINFSFLANTLNETESETKKYDLISHVKNILAQIAELQTQTESYANSTYKNPLHLQNMQKLLEILLSHAIFCLQNVVVNNQIKKDHLKIDARRGRANEVIALESLTKRLFETNDPRLQFEQSTTLATAESAVDLDLFLQELLQDFDPRNSIASASAAAKINMDTSDGEARLDALLTALDTDNARLRISAAVLARGASSAFDFGGVASSDKSAAAAPATASAAPTSRPSSP